ncbi:Hypothetical predicted protein [Marmota monax]|uniref:FBA domain-containing protein n=1 Tax=Marmota monax TaxID=9995 RepID=A0A5E4BW78_MARMO|nr:Hypothetical predicted protein [Marmota monax]
MDALRSGPDFGGNGAPQSRWGAGAEPSHGVGAGRSYRHGRGQHQRAAREHPAGAVHPCACPPVAAALRLVCSLWRDLIDLVTLWKRKCLREGFITEDWDQPVADWKIFYFLRSLHRNLLHNPCAEEGFEFWSLDVNGGDEWKVEDLSKDQRKEFPNDQVKKYFVTSYYTCLKSQVVDLKAEGYWEELMDTTRPDIQVKDWFAARPDCGSKYQLCVQLLSSAHAPLGTFQPDPVMIQQKSDARWREVSHTFSNYPPGVRYIWFQHGGVDTHYWAGWYGPRVTNSSITIGPPLP